ncbi:uncharacterized protein STEHIDRAFT_110373 [Stereum hirsutum FP-91666 SS1]|uniref:uncharacterized protein n=1 Tax=Stereum hirsutum (strain FP-91666) TaxID=721885 RepID=UPI00044106E0|nr:uncharacterized protein STEHIDRAFT_110373 [Stereum hirsutum FP-91666 SS1]EIM87064.1 hypothetical protein STEHIDRAFT_110373 [Stereum hirsutum FP-91666 SS1]
MPFRQAATSRTLATACDMGEVTSSPHPIGMIVGLNGKGADVYTIVPVQVTKDTAKQQYQPEVHTEPRTACQRKPKDRRQSEVEPLKGTHDQWKLSVRKAPNRTSTRRGNGDPQRSIIREKAFVPTRDPSVQLNAGTENTRVQKVEAPERFRTDTAQCGCRIGRKAIPGDYAKKGADDAMFSSDLYFEIRDK